MRCGKEDLELLRMLVHERRRTRELRALVNRYDPFGLMAAGAPEDEYADFVGPLLRRLAEGRSAPSIAHWLQTEVGAHYGSVPAQAEPLAAAAVAWYAAGWPGSEPVPSGEL